MKRKLKITFTKRYKRRRLNSSNSFLLAKRRHNLRKKRFQRRVRRAINIEKKMIMASFNGQIPATRTGAVVINPDTCLIRVDMASGGGGQFVMSSPTMGTGQAQRIGNKITAVNGWLKLTYQPQSDGGGTTNIQVLRVVAFYDKQNPTTTPTPYANGDFFQFFSGAGYTGFTGTMQDIVMEINKDRYNVFWERTYKLGYAHQNGSADAEPSWANAANNDFKLFYKKKYGLMKTCIKNLVFNDQTTNPLRRGCWIMVFGCNPVGLQNPVDQSVGRLFGQVCWLFTDA